MVPDDSTPTAATPPPLIATETPLPQGREPAPRRSWSFLKDSVLAGLLCLFVLVFLFQPFRVEGVSMLPHFAHRDRIIVNKLSYRLSPIQRGDVVVFWFPEDPEKSFIKRVIGLPGDVVEIRDGSVIINDDVLDEPYLDQALHVEERRAPVLVRPGYYYVLGDHRGKSFDSRNWGLVPERYIFGKVLLSYWPPEHVGLVEPSSH